MGVAMARSPMLGRLLAATLLLSSLALAGCSDAPEATGDEPPLPREGVEDCQGDCPVGEALAPAWKVGQWWDHHWYFGPEDSTGFVVKAIVVAKGSAGYQLATDEVIDAASHAAFYFHDQGVMSPQDWTVRDAGGQFQFPWYSFPLHDGKTWTAREENLDFFLDRVSRDLTMTATAINGTPGAFMVEARDGDGLRARYDYQPALGWFSEYYAYDPSSESGDYQIRMATDANGQGWSGTYYTATADFLLNTYSDFTPFAPSPPDPPASFTITAEHTHTMAILFSYAVGGGAAHSQLLAPDGQHWEAYATTFPDGSTGPLQSQPFVFLPAIPGEWRYAFVAGDSVYSGGGCQAFGVKLSSGTL